MEISCVSIRSRSTPRKHGSLQNGMLPITQAFLQGAENLLDAATTESVLIKPANNYAVPSITTHSAEIKKCYTDEVEKILIGQESTKEGMENAKLAADKILQQ